MHSTESTRPRFLRAAGRLVSRPMDRALGWHALGRMHAGTRESGKRGAALLAANLAELGVTGELVGDAVPETGGLLVVANLPFGGVEALALLGALLARRPDVCLLADPTLGRILELEELCLPLPAARRRTGGASVPSAAAASELPVELERARRWIEAGGALVAFPASGLARQRSGFDGLLDGPWRQDIGALIEAVRPRVLPVHVSGRGPRPSRLGGAVPAKLRQALLPRELLGRRVTSVVLRPGRALEPETWGRYQGASNLMGYLRLATYALAGEAVEGRAAPSEADRANAEPLVAPLAAPTDTALLAAELARLSPECTLLSTGDFDVLVAGASELPQTMRELGRLREQTFRAVGEGTGRALDLDAFDEHYEHLILWDRTAGRIAGAYRLGRTDRLLAAFGRTGLYTSSLFRYRRNFLKGLGPALELGRAFVTTDYQRGHLPLLLLWQGIGRFVAANPRYATLFGPVSISADYPAVTRYVMARRLLAATAGKPEARGNFRLPKRDVAGVDLVSLMDLCGSIEELGRVVADIDPDGRGIPVLLRQYLKLNGRVLAFNVDEDFGGALDALLVMDLRESDPRVLGRYFGHAGLERFLAFHRSPELLRAVGG
ncbi:MAG: GNAT family N-acetyltransferase [Planctomycetota bacterium]|nr:GNAT family N-acetyltransferase [Planctomycetota bacterium]